MNNPTHVAIFGLLCVAGMVLLNLHAFFEVQACHARLLEYEAPLVKAPAGPYKVRPLSPFIVNEY